MSMYYNIFNIEVLLEMKHGVILNNYLFIEIQHQNECDSIFVALL